MRKLSERLVAFGAMESQSAKTATTKGFDACERLRSQLLPLLGKSSMRAIISRAFVRACGEADWLRKLRVQNDGSIGGFEELEGHIGPQEIAEGDVVLLAQILRLLFALVGIKVTLWMVQEAWPMFPVDLKLKELTET